MSDIVERLREQAELVPVVPRAPWKAMAEAADEITSLRAQVAALEGDAGKMRGALVRARDGYISQRATGLPCQSVWLHATLGVIDAALAARKG